MKAKRRLFPICVWMAICVLLTSVPMPGNIIKVSADTGVSSSFTYSEDFENVEGTAEEYLKSTGYTLSNMTEGNASVEVVTEEGTGNHVLKFSTTAATNSTSTASATLQYISKYDCEDGEKGVDKAVLKYRWKSPASFDGNDVLELPRLENWDEQYNWGKKLFHLGDYGGTFRKNTGSWAIVDGAGMKNGDWNDIEIFVDTIAKKYDVCLNGVCVLSQQALYKEDYIGRIYSFSTDIYKTTTAQDYYFDDIQLFEYKDDVIAFDNPAAEMTVGDTQQLKVKYTPTGGACSASFTTSDASIATVDENGVVKALKGGTVTITATPKLTGMAAISTTVTVAEDITSSFTYHEDFENVEGTAEEYLKSTGYTLSNMTEGNASVEVVTEEGTGNHVLKFSTTAATNSTSTASATLQYISKYDCEDGEKGVDKAVLKYRWKSPASFDGNDVLELPRLENWDEQYNWGKKLFHLGDYGGTFRKNTGSWAIVDGAGMKNGDWNDIEIFVDTIAKKYDVCLNGVCVLSQQALYKEDYIGRIYSFSTDIYKTTTAQDYYFDDIQLFEYKNGVIAFDNPTTEMSVGDTQQLKVKYTPTGGACSASFTTSDASIATVDENGVVRALKGGTVTITATPKLTGMAADAVSMTVTVEEGAVSGIIYSEDFENTDVLTFLSDYTVVNAGDDVVVEIVPEEEGSENSVLKIAQAQKRSVGDYFLHYIFDDGVSAQKAVMKLNIKAEKNDGYMYLPRLSQNLSGTSYRRLTNLMFASGRLLEDLNVGSAFTIADMQKETWHAMEIMVDIEKGVYDVHLNDECVISQHTLYPSNGQTINSFVMGLASSAVNTYYLDNLQVLEYVEGRSLSFDNPPTEVYLGHPVKLQLKFDPIDTSCRSVAFTSSDESIATVDANGNITGLKAGKVTITATSSLTNIEPITAEIEIKEATVEDIEIKIEDEEKTAVSLPVGGHVFIEASVVPSNAVTQEISFVSNNENVVTVDEWGELVAVGAGTANVTVKCDNVEKIVSVTVTEATDMKTIYVSNNGSDSGTGTSTDKVSLKRAMDLVAQSNDNMTGNILVILDGGYYRQTETLQFTDAHSGTNGYSVIWRAAEGEEPVIGGGIQIPGSAFEKWSENEAIYVADVEDGVQTRQLFVNNVRATRARSEGSLTNATFNKDFGFICDDTEIATYKNVQDLELVFYNKWTNSRCGVASVELINDNTELKMIMEEPGWQNVTTKGSSTNVSEPPVWYENAIELLDKPGEWYLDEAENKLYYMPRQWEVNMSGVTVTIPTVEELVTVAGTSYDQMAENIYFEGITFADTTWLRPSTNVGHADNQNNHIRVSTSGSSDKLPEAAVTVTKANSIHFTDCTFTRLGITALKMVKGVQNSPVVGNRFYDISGSAISIGDPQYQDTEIVNPSDVRMLMKNCDILNNYIHDVAVDYNSAAAISVGFAADMDLSYNEIFDAPYSAFHIGYGWTAGKENILKNMNIAHNVMYNVASGAVYDGGAVYVLGMTGTGASDTNFVYGNYIRKQTQPYAALYADTGSTGWVMDSNVIDLSEVTDWPDIGIGLNWALLKGPNLRYSNTYTTTDKAAILLTDVGGQTYYPTGDFYNEEYNVRINNTTLCADANWPTKAKDIIAATGLQTGYQSIRNDQAEIINTNISENGITVGANGTFSIQLEFTDSKDKAINDAEIKVYYEVEDKSIAEVSADGQVTGKAAGQTPIYIYVVSNNILDVVESKVYVDDEITEVIIEDFTDSIVVEAVAAGKQLNVTAVTKYGRTFEPETISYQIADTSVATVDANGYVTPIKAGKTTLSVTVNAAGMEKTVEYELEVVESLTTHAFGDLFDDTNDEYWYKSGVSSWEYKNDSKIITTMSGFANFKGSKFGSEVLKFKLNIDSSQKTGGWPSVQLRAQDYDDFTGSKTATGYMFGFGSGGLEIYRFNDGERTTFYCPASESFTPIFGYSDYTFTHGVDHDVEVAAINVDNGVRLLLKVDGETIVDIVDDKEGAIKDSGYFGVIGRGETFTLTKEADLEGLTITDLAEIYDDANVDNWYKNGAVSWIYEEDSKITTELNQCANYKKAFESELLQFTLNIDSSKKTGGWPSIQLRNQNYEDYMGSKTATGYMFGFGAGGLEIYRFNNGVRTTFYCPKAESFIPIHGYSDYTFTHGVDHDIQVGAVNVDNGVRLILIVDGETIIDIVDEGENRIEESGYFGLIGRGETFTLTKKIVEDNKEDEGITPTPTPTPGAGEGEGTTPTPTPTAGAGEGESATPTPTPTPGAGEGESATPTPTPDTGGDEDTNNNGDVSDNEDASSDSAEATAGSATETGDSSNPLLWSVLLLLALGGVTAIGIWGRKNRKRI